MFDSTWRVRERFFCMSHQVHIYSQHTQGRFRDDTNAQIPQQKDRVPRYTSTFSPFRKTFFSHNHSDFRSNARIGLVRGPTELRWLKRQGIMRGKWVFDAQGDEIRESSALSGRVCTPPVRALLVLQRYHEASGALRTSMVLYDAISMY